MRHGKHLWLVVKSWGAEYLHTDEADAIGSHEADWGKLYPKATSQLIRYTRDEDIAALEAERDAARRVVSEFISEATCADWSDMPEDARFETALAWLRKHEEVKAERDALRAALLPFSKLLGDHHDSDRDEKKVFGINGNDFTVGDLRRAKAARGGA